MAKEAGALVGFGGSLADEYMSSQRRKPDMRLGIPNHLQRLCTTGGQPSTRKSAKDSFSDLSNFLKRMPTFALVSTNSGQNVRAAKRGGMTHDPLAARGASSPASKPLDEKHQSAGLTSKKKNNDILHMKKRHD